MALESAFPQTLIDDIRSGKSHLIVSPASATVRLVEMNGRDCLEVTLGEPGSYLEVSVVSGGKPHDGREGT